MLSLTPPGSIRGLGRPISTAGGRDRVPLSHDGGGGGLGHFANRSIFLRRRTLDGSKGASRDAHPRSSNPPVFVLRPTFISLLRTQEKDWLRWGAREADLTPRRVVYCSIKDVFLCLLCRAGVEVCSVRRNIDEMNVKTHVTLTQIITRSINWRRRCVFLKTHNFPHFSSANLTSPRRNPPLMRFTRTSFRTRGSAVSPTGSLSRQKATFSVFFETRRKLLIRSKTHGF